MEEGGVASPPPRNLEWWLSSFTPRVIEDEFCPPPTFDHSWTRQLVDMPLFSRAQRVDKECSPSVGWGVGGAAFVHHWAPIRTSHVQVHTWRHRLAAKMRGYGGASPIETKML